jgi:RNA polymerase sigma factor (sigma-70 family)
LERTLDQRTDEQLLVATPQDTGAFAEFYRRHVDKVIGFGLRRMHTPEDVADFVAAVFVQVIESVKRFDPDRGRAVPWLLGISANTMSVERRRRARAFDAAQRVAGRRYLTPADHELVEERLDAAAAARRVYMALAALPDGERAVAALVMVDELSPAEAAEALGLRPVAVRARLARARRKLRAALEAPMPEAPTARPIPTARTKEIPS